VPSGPKRNNISGFLILLIYYFVKLNAEYEIYAEITTATRDSHIGTANVPIWAGHE